MAVIFLHISKLYCISQTQQPYLRGEEMAQPICLENAFLKVAQDKIVEIGLMQDWDKNTLEPHAEVIDCTGRIIFPGFVDSHTHLIFPKTREDEFVYKLKGMSYEEIARRGGGILNSAQKMAEISEEQLLAESFVRLQEVLALGTTTLEIKSGYGLTLAGELKMLRVAQQLKKMTHQTIKTTFLGAHTFPLAYKTNRQGYIDLICKEMLPQIAEEKLADFIDVFCENIAFSLAETEQILNEGAKYGLPAKIHANQLSLSGGVQLGVKLGAVSVDHLEKCGEAEIEALKRGNTLPTLLPSCSYFLKDTYAPARQLIAANLPVCLATDYNPGSSPSGNMAFVMSLACTQQRMLPEEALVACTLNGAAALQISEQVGSLEIGKKADLILTKPIANLARIPYSFGSQLIEKVMVGGEWA